MVKKPEVKKEAAKVTTVIKTVAPVVAIPEEKPVSPNITCTACGYSVIRARNEGLVGIACPKCKGKGKLI